MVLVNANIAHSSKTKIVIVDDHMLSIQGLKTAIEHYNENMEVVGSATSTTEVMGLIDTHKPNLIIVDLNVDHNISGQQLIFQIAQEYPHIKIIVLTVFDDEAVAQRLLPYVKGYLLKDCATDEIIRAIYSVAAGEVKIAPNLAVRMAHQAIDFVKPSVLPNEPIKDSPFEILSPREKIVVNLITQGKKAPEIAAQLNLSKKTVNTYRYRIFRKLNITSRSDIELMRLARQYGYPHS